MHIDFQDQTNDMTTDIQTTLKKLVRYAAKLEKLPDNIEVSISFVDNQAIQTLNHTYRQLNEVTDVLSFGMYEDDWEQIYRQHDRPITLGDIVISTDRAREQAIEYKHSYLRELGFLTVHGLLHLIGYDHLNQEAEAIMFAKQSDILAGFGLER